MTIPIGKALVGRRAVLATGLAAGAAATLPARARAQQRPIRIGVLTDMSGVYAANTGPGSVLGARLAIEDFSSAHPAIKVELVQADLQLKPDVGAGDRRRLVRQPGRRSDHRRAAVLRRLRHRRPGEAEGQGGDLHRGRLGRHHWHALRSQPSALGLRHLVDAARRGGRGGEGAAATPGSSSPPTTPSAIRWKRMPRAS